MRYEVQVMQVGPQPIAVVRRRAKSEQLATVVPKSCGDVWNFIRSAHIERPGRNIAVYLDCNEGEINIEVGVEVTHQFTGDGEVVCSATPAGTVATTVHVGPYDRLGDAHSAIRAGARNAIARQAGLSGRSTATGPTIRRSFAPMFSIYWTCSAPRTGRTSAGWVPSGAHPVSLACPHGSGVARRRATRPGGPHAARGGPGSPADGQGEHRAGRSARPTPGARRGSPGRPGRSESSRRRAGMKNQ